MLKRDIHKNRIAPKEMLRDKLVKLLQQHYPDQIIPDDIPNKWEKHGDLILLPSSSFRHHIWLNLGDVLWNIVATVLKAKKVARKHRIKNDDYRTPSVELLKGSDGWVVHVDNKIKYTYDVTKCMFSSGNITEKLRIAKFLCQDEVVVDLYAGIGYFTLPFLIHAKASLVHACEWNPNAVEALEKSLILNNVREKCIIHFGDNRKVCPEKIADRINLGLIPSSETGWETACKALKPCGGILHIHGNVTSYSQSKLTSNIDLKKSEWKSWAEITSLTIKDILSSLYKNNWNTNILNISHVKSYAPHIDHLVLDLQCKPSN